MRSGRRSSMLRRNVLLPSSEAKSKLSKQLACNRLLTLCYLSDLVFDHQVEGISSFETSIKSIGLYGVTPHKTVL
jgi:hypothetical protein